MNKCKIVKDLMPLVSENIASEESRNFVKTHIESCLECKKAWESINDTEIDNAFELEAIPIKNVRDKINIDKKKSNLTIGLLIVYVLLIIFQFLTRPVLLPVDKAILNFEKKGEDIVLTLSPEVAGINISNLESDPDTNQKNYSLMAWTNRINKYMPTRNESKYLIEKPETKLIYYISGNDVDTILGENNTPSKRATLPRLALNYYVKLAGVIFLITAIFGTITNAKWLKYIAVFSFSYVLTHFLVVGINSTTYQMRKDFLIILVLASLLTAFFIMLIKKKKV